MNNNVLIVGRLTSEPTGDIITIACPRSYKNAEGVYETDFIPVELSGLLTRQTMEYCRKGDIIGIRGALKSDKVDDGDGHFVYRMTVMADRVTFLNSRGGNNNE